MTIEQIIRAALKLKRKNGSSLLTEKDQLALSGWLSGTLDSKGVTMFKRSIGKLISKVLPLTMAEFRPEIVKANPKMEEYKASCYNDIVCLRTHYIRSGFDLNGEELIAVNEFNHFVENIRKMFYDAVEEYLLNIRKTAQKQKQEQIKGRVNQYLLDGLQQIRNDWEEKIYQSWVNHLTRERTGAQDLLTACADGRIPADRERYVQGLIFRRILGHVQSTKYETGYRTSDLTPCSDLFITTEARKNAIDEADGWMFKMCDKLGGLLPRGFVIGIEVGYGKDAYDCFMNVKCDKFSFSMINSIVRNTSPLGTPFFQYPCNFKFLRIGEGKVINALSEYELKSHLNKLFGE